MDVSPAPSIFPGGGGKLEDYGEGPPLSPPLGEEN